MGWIIGNWQEIGIVAGKATLMFVVAAFGLRLGERRTIAQWSIIDYVAAVAIGAIVGRTAIAASQSFLTGAVALLTLIVVHRVVSLLRFRPWARNILDHRVRVLVHAGTLQRNQLRRCGLTEEDVFAHLREHGVFDLNDVDYLLFESKGGLTLVRRNAGGAAPLIRDGLDGSAPKRPEAG